MFCNALEKTSLYPTKRYVQKQMTKQTISVYATDYEKKKKKRKEKTNITWFRFSCICISFITWFGTGNLLDHSILAFVRFICLPFTFPWTFGFKWCIWFFWPIGRWWWMCWDILNSLLCTTFPKMKIYYNICRKWLLSLVITRESWNLIFIWLRWWWWYLRILVIFFISVIVFSSTMSSTNIGISNITNIFTTNMINSTNIGSNTTTQNRWRSSTFPSIMNNIVVLLVDSFCTWVVFSWNKWLLKKKKKKKKKDYMMWSSNSCQMSGISILRYSK